MRDLVEVCARRKRAVFATAAIVTLLSVLGCCFPLREYTASSTIHLENASSDLQAEVAMLQSTGVASKVIRDSNLERDLEENEAFNPPFNPVYGALGLVAPRRPSAMATAENPSATAVRAFQSDLQVKAEPDARLLRVNYTHRNPLVATAVVKDLLQTFLDNRQENQAEAPGKLAHWLESRIADLNQQNQALQAKVIATENNNARQQAAIQLSQAQMNSMVKASAAQVARTGNPELIAQLSPTLLENSAALLLPMHNLLRQQKALQVRVDQDSAQLGKSSVEVTQEQASMRGLEQSLRAEVNLIKNRTQLDFETASSTEEHLRTTYEAQRTAAEKQTGQGAGYAGLSLQADQSYALYQDLHRRLQQPAALALPHSSHVTITDHMTVSIPGKTAAPLYLALGAMAGVLLACCAALLVESLGDKPWKSAADAQLFEEFQRPGLGILDPFRYECRYSSPSANQGSATGRWVHTQFTNNGWGGAQVLPDQPSSGMTLLTGRGGTTKPSVTPARLARFGVIYGRGSEKRTATVSTPASDSSAAG
jgi:uncharacterized protein involved in exopolysaccharide biosynthesis